jgi:hypothetical protein
MTRCMRRVDEVAKGEKGICVLKGGRETEGGGDGGGRVGGGAGEERAEYPTS